MKHTKEKNILVNFEDTKLEDNPELITKINLGGGYMNIFVLVFREKF